MSHFQDSFWVSLWSCREIQCRAHECTSVEVNLGLPSSLPCPPAQKAGTRRPVAVYLSLHVLNCNARFTSARLLSLMDQFI